MSACGDIEDTADTAEYDSEIQRGPQGLSFDQGWRVDQHIRLVHDLNGDHRDDIVAFGNGGVHVALSDGAGFETPRLELQALGNNHGFTPANSIRTLADVTGDGHPDIVAFGPTTVLVSIRGATGFAPPTVWSTQYSSPTTWAMLAMADVNGDQRADIVGIDSWGVYVSPALPNSSFGPREMWLRGFSVTAGNWLPRHLRLLTDVNNDGKADLIGFGDAGVWYALSDGQRFRTEAFGVAEFGINRGWDIAAHVRSIANVNGDKFPDIVGFGNLGVTVATGNGNGWNIATRWTTAFGNNVWDSSKHLRMLGDVDGDGDDDVVGISADKVVVSHSNGAEFETAAEALVDFTYNREWRVEKHPRLLLDLDGDRQLDLLGFFNDTIFTARLTTAATLPEHWDEPACTSAALQSAPAFCQGPWRYAQTNRCNGVDPSCAQQCTTFSPCQKWENGAEQSAVTTQEAIVRGGTQHCIQACIIVPGDETCEPADCSGLTTDITAACQGSADGLMSTLLTTVTNSVMNELTFDSSAAQIQRRDEARNMVAVSLHYYTRISSPRAVPTGAGGRVTKSWDQEARCDLSSRTAQPKAAPNNACSCATPGPATCAHDCGTSTLYTIPGALRPASPYIAGQECLTYDEMPVVTPADIQNKFTKLWNAYEGSVPSTVTAESFRLGLRRRLKLMYELWGERLINTIVIGDQVDQAISLYNDFPADNPRCGTQDAPVPAECENPTITTKRGELVRCQRLLEPHASEGVASLAASDCIALLSGYLDLAALPADDDACRGPQLRQLATHKVFQLEDKQLGVIESAPTTLGSLPRQLWLFDSWFAITKRAASLGVLAAPDQLQRDTSYLIGRFWDRMRANSTFDDEIAQLQAATTPQEAEQALGLSAVSGRAVEQSLVGALFTVPSSTIQPENVALTRPPLRGLPLLAMLGDGLKPLMDDLNGLAIFHDIACQFRDCRTPVTSTPSRHAWNILAGLENDHLTDKVAANPHPLAGWTPVFAKIAAQQPLLRQAIADAVGGTGGLTHAEQETIHPLAHPLWGQFQHARAFHDHYEATGQFESTARNQLQGSLLEQDQPRVVADLRNRAARLQSAVTTYHQGLLDIVQAQLAVMNDGANLETLFAQRIRKASEMNFKSINLSGLRASGEDEDLAFGSLAGSFATIQASLDEGAYVDVSDTQQLELKGANALFTDSRLITDIDNHTLPGLPRGTMLAIHTAGKWRTSCALRNTRVFRPDGPGGDGRIVDEAEVGPEGYTVNWTGTHYEAKSAGHSIGIENTIGTSFKMCYSPPAPLEWIGVDIQSCGYADLHTSIAFNTSGEHGSDSRVAASFSSGIRLQNTPFPEAAAGSLLVVLTEPNSTEVREVRPVLGGGTSILITEPSDAYIVINDKSCVDADTHAPLTVSIRTMISQTAVATAALTGMANVLTYLGGQRTDLVKQGALLPNQATMIRQEANLRLQEQLESINLTELPPQLAALFDAFVSHEIVKTERQIEIMAIERSLQLDLLDMAQVNDEIRAGQNRSRLSKLIPLWMLRDLDHDQLRHGMVELLHVSRDFLRPILELWYPQALQNAASGPAINALINADIDTSLITLADRSRIFVDALLNAYENGVFGARPSAPQLPLVVLSFPRPGFAPPAPDDEPELPFWRQADEVRSRRVWDAIDANTVAHFEVTPDDIYRERGGGFALLSCAEVVPLIKTMAIHVVRPGGDTSNQILNGLSLKFDGFGAATQSFVLPEGPRVYELARYIENGASVPSLWQDFELPVRYGESEAALTTFLSAPRQTRPVGLSATGAFDIDFSILPRLAGRAALGRNDAFPATEIQLIMEIDSRASSLRPNWVSRCQ